MQRLLYVLVGDHMTFERQGEKTDSFQPVSFNQPEDIELERKSGFAVGGGKRLKTVIFYLIPVVCT